LGVLSTALGIVATSVVAMSFAANASSCDRKTPSSVTIAKSMGDVYNQLASDGDESFPSYVVKATYGTGDYAFTWQSHHSKYESQHAGQNVDTVVHTIAGPTVDVPWFNPTDETDELRVERCVRFLGMYVGVGYLTTAANYDYPLGYRNIRGSGVGVERYADDTRRWDLFTALYYYPYARGGYGLRTVAFSAVTFDGGFRWRATSSGGVLFGLYQEIRELHPGTRVAQTIRVAPYVGYQFKL
jgi:hypothetical protein